MRSDDGPVGRHPSNVPGGLPRPRVSPIERLEIFAAVLLAVATVATAWSSYQAARWTAEQGKAGARANALRVQSATAEGRSNTFGSIDVTVFSQWLNATATGEAKLADFYRARFRDEFKPAFDAWLATNPLANPNSPSTPFQMPQYVRADQVQAEDLNGQANVLLNKALRDLQNASNYVLCVVLFAVALFFAGLSTRFTSPWPRRAVLAAGTIVFFGTLGWLLTFPVSFAL